MASPHAALDSEVAQLKTWLTAFERRYPNVVHPDVDRVKARLKEIDDAKKRDKRQAKRAKKLWGTVLETVGQHHPQAAEALKALAANPSDTAALSTVGTAIAKAASKDPKLAQIASVALPAITALFVDDDDKED